VLIVAQSTLEHSLLSEELATLASKRLDPGEADAACLRPGLERTSWRGLPIHAWQECCSEDGNAAKGHLGRFRPERPWAGYVLDEPDGRLPVREAPMTESTTPMAMTASAIQTNRPTMSAEDGAALVPQADGTRA
jgi:hypothetical protein